MPLSHLSGRSCHQELLKYLENIGSTKNNLRVGQKVVLLQMSHSMQISRTCPLTLEDRMNFLHLTEPNPTHNLGKVKVSHQIDAENCDYDDDDDDNSWTA